MGYTNLFSPSVIDSLDPCYKVDFPINIALWKLLAIGNPIKFKTLVQCGVNQKLKFNGESDSEKPPQLSNFIDD